MGLSRAQEKWYKHLRRLAWVALVCTLLLAILLCASSLMSSKDSAALTNWLKGLIHKVAPDADVDEGGITGFSLGFVGMDRQEAYCNDVVRMVLNAEPAGATLGEWKASSSNEDVAKVVGDQLIFGRAGMSTVRVWLADNPAIQQEIRVQCLGLRPEAVEELVLAESSRTLMRGESAQIVLNDGQVSAKLEELEITVDKPECLTVRSGNFYGHEPGVVQVTFTLGALHLTETVTVEENPNFAPPTVLTAKSGVRVFCGEDFSLADLIEEGKDAASYCRMEAVGVNADRIAVHSSGKKGHGVTAGTVRVRIYSNYDESVWTEVELTVAPRVPTKLLIVGENYVSYYAGGTTFSVRNEWGDTLSAKDVTWRVVSGSATISAKGELEATGLTPIVIEATATVEGVTLMAEHRVVVRMYDDFYGFVRKVAGHFSLFALLGFGFAAVWMLLGKPKWATPIFALLCGVGMAGLSEVLQLPVFSQGRYASYVDVLLDSAGVALGVALFWLVWGVLVGLNKLIGHGGLGKVAKRMSWRSLGRKLLEVPQEPLEEA